MSIQMKPIAIRLFIVVAAFLVAFYEPGLAVFAVGAGIAAFIILRDAAQTPKERGRK